LYLYIFLNWSYAIIRLLKKNYSSNRIHKNIIIFNQLKFDYVLFYFIFFKTVYFIYITLLYIGRNVKLTIKLKKKKSTTYINNNLIFKNNTSHRYKKKSALLKVCFFYLEIYKFSWAMLIEYSVIFWINTTRTNK